VSKRGCHLAAIATADPDVQIRLAAFERLERLTAIHGPTLPWSTITQGFTAGGEKHLFASTAEGIFKPAAMSGMLSIKTVVPKPKGRVWYHDQAGSDDRLLSTDELLPYAFKGDNPNDTRNRWLREAMERQLPLIYFFGIAPGVYQPLFPVHVVDWDPSALTCHVAMAAATSSPGLWVPASADERRYAMRQVKQRLHQSMFRERVMDAYGARCALTGLPAVKLLDAAHIVPDADADLGQPDVRNGICVSKIHHAAFDANLIGIDPDYRIHIAEALLEMHDGPMLEQGIKALQGQLLRLPLHRQAWPDRDRLAVRFDAFLRAA
jgi:putative restriction endonuclease